MSRTFHWTLIDEDGDYVVFSDADDVARMPSAGGGLAYSGTNRVESATRFDLVQALTWGAFQGWCVRPVAFNGGEIVVPWSSPIDARVLRALATAMGIDVTASFVDASRPALAGGA